MGAAIVWREICSFFEKNGMVEDKRKNLSEVDVAAKPCSWRYAWCYLSEEDRSGAVNNTVVTIESHMWQRDGRLVNTLEQYVDHEDHSRSSSLFLSPCGSSWWKMAPLLRLQIHASR